MQSSVSEGSRLYGARLLKTGIILLEVSQCTFTTLELDTELSTVCHNKSPTCTTNQVVFEHSLQPRHVSQTALVGYNGSLQPVSHGVTETSEG